MLENIKNIFNIDKIGEPPWEYSFLVNLPESEYPKYLAKIFKYRTGEKLPLKYDFKKQAWIIDKKKCKTFNQKIQWIKLYGVTELMKKCTDKVAVRDYVSEKIGEEYLKPVLQIIGENPLSQPLSRERGEFANPSADIPSLGRGLGRGLNNDVYTYFDQIQWDKLPNAFVVKCNHGCKWQYIIKDKENFLNTPQLFETVKKNMTGWLEQNYSFWGGFELQYKEIEPKIIIEPLLRDNINKNVEEIHWYCFDGRAKIAVRIKEGTNNKITLYDENLCIINDVFSKGDENIKCVCDNLAKQTIDLSLKLAKEFLFVRVDWMIFENKVYFEELTFTPHSGFNAIINENFNLTLGKLINIMERI